MSLRLNSIINNKYKILEKLDEGRYGHVYKTQNIQNNQIYALKSISKMDMKKNFSLRKNLSREIFIHSKLNHPNIVKFIETFQTSSRKIIILEYIDVGDIFDLMYNYLSAGSDEEQHFNEDEARDYFYQLIQALIYLRDSNIIHRDLKPENILITSNGTIKLADFGWAINKPSNDNVGTTKYSSPEMIFSHKNYDHKTDIWSSGIILYEFLFGKTPFRANKEKKIEDKIEKNNLQFPSETPVSQEAKNLIQSILQSLPHRRLEYENILQHPWMKPALEKASLQDTEIDLDLESSSHSTSHSIFNSNENDSENNSENNSDNENENDNENNDEKYNSFDEQNDEIFSQPYSNSENINNNLDDRSQDYSDLEPQQKNNLDHNLDHNLENDLKNKLENNLKND